MINKRQEKELADLIDESVFEKSEFSVTIIRDYLVRGRVIKSISHIATPYYFYIWESIGGYGGSHSIEFSPNDDSMVRTFSGANWEDVKKFFKFWLKNLKEELEVKDIWTSVSRNKELFEIAEGSDEKFTEEEIKLLEERLEEVKEKVRESKEIPPEKKTLLLEAFDYLKKVARKVTKLDWTNIMVGVIVRNYLTEENLRFVFGLIKYIFKELLLSK
jgi:hypothetical protein